MDGVVVITGGGGFVGQHLHHELREAWPQVVLESWDLPGVDITAPETYRARLREAQPVWLVHLAAFSSAQHSFAAGEEVRRVNVEGTRALLETVREASPATRVLAVSSADIYGTAGADGTPLAELALDQCEPRNPYAASKLEMEQMIVEDFNDITVRVRPFPHIGPAQGPGFVVADFASQIAAIEAGQQAPQLRVGNLTAVRDFTDVRDVVRAYRLLLEQGAAGAVYNVASGRAVGIQEILDQLLQLSAAQIEVVQDPARMRPSDVPILIGSAAKLTALTGWQATIPLPESLRAALAWQRQQAA